MRNSFNNGLGFLAFDLLDLLVMTLFVNACFAANPDSFLQLGIVITLINTNGKAKIDHYGSLKSNRVTCSAFVAELFVTVHGFDISLTIQPIPSAMLDRVVQLHVYTDS